MLPAAAPAATRCSAATAPWSRCSASTAHARRWGRRSWSTSSIWRTGGSTRLPRSRPPPCTPSSNAPPTRPACRWRPRTAPATPPGRAAGPRSRRPARRARPPPDAPARRRDLRPRLLDPPLGAHRPTGEALAASGSANGSRPGCRTRATRNARSRSRRPAAAPCGAAGRARRAVRGRGPWRRSGWRTPPRSASCACCSTAPTPPPRTGTRWAAGTTAPPRATVPPEHGAFPPPLAPQLLIREPERRGAGLRVGNRLYGAPRHDPGAARTRARSGS